MIDVVELFQHWHAGRRIGELSSSLGIDPKTVRKYVTPARDAGIVPGGPALSGGPPGTMPASLAGWIYLRTVLGSMPSDELSSPIRRPACQCWNSSTTSITLIVLLATRPPRLGDEGDAQRICGRSEGSLPTREFRDGNRGNSVTAG